mmetsp:Transcript_24761/g.64248  ORF Transcript_24761/g.64248 Transcript_24761/m.64248 type:complete len:105 (+) Transcript_24761:630-944(+)
MFPAYTKGTGLDCVAPQSEATPSFQAAGKDYAAAAVKARVIGHEIEEDGLQSLASVPEGPGDGGTHGCSAYYCSDFLMAVRMDLRAWSGDIVGTGTGTHDGEDC